MPLKPPDNTSGKEEIVLKIGNMVKSQSHPNNCTSFLNTKIIQKQSIIEKDIEQKFLSDNFVGIFQLINTH